MSIKNKLESIDLDNLDAFEETMYLEYSKRMSKVDALQIIINNAEGDYTQLSDDLAEIAQEQDQENI